MKKKILAIAVAVLGTFGMVASAQMPDKSYKPQKFTDFAFEGVLLELDQQAKIDSINALYQPNGPMQAANCQQAKCAKDKCAAGQCVKDQCVKDQCKKVEGMVCDTAKCVAGNRHSRHGMRPGKGQRPGAGMMRGMRPSPEYVAAVKEVLTPEQYVTFLENIVNMPMPESGRMMPGQTPNHGQKNGARICHGHDKGQCPNKDKKDKKGGDQNKDRKDKKNKK